MEVLQLVNSRVVPSPEFLSISPFKEIWNSDNSREKQDSILTFTYMLFVLSPKQSNPYHGYTEEERPKEAKKELWGDEDYPTTDYMIMCVMKFKEILEHESPTYPLYMSAMSGADKLRKFLDGFDLNERTNSGAAVIKPADITKALSEIPNVVKSLNELRKKVEAELLEAETKTRNQREVGDYER